MEMVTNLVRIELAYINTNHPDFWKAVPPLTSYRRAGSAESTTSNSTTSYNTMSNGEEEVAMNSIPATAVPPSPKTASSPGLFSYLFRSHPLSQPIISNNTNSGGGMKRPLKTGSELPTKDLPVLTEKEEFETQLIMTLIHSYFGIVRKNLMDSVPKSIMHFLVNATLDNLPATLVEELYREELLGELLKEDESVKGRRIRIRRELEAHRQALTLISSHINDPF